MLYSTRHTSIRHNRPWSFSGWRRSKEGVPTARRPRERGLEGHHPNRSAIQHSFLHACIEDFLLQLPKHIERKRSVPSLHHIGRPKHINLAAASARCFVRRVNVDRLCWCVVHSTSQCMVLAKQRRRRARRDLNETKEGRAQSVRRRSIVPVLRMHVLEAPELSLDYERRRLDDQEIDLFGEDGEREQLQQCTKMSDSPSNNFNCFDE